MVVLFTTHTHLHELTAIFEVDMLANDTAHFLQCTRSDIRLQRLAVLICVGAKREDGREGYDGGCGDVGGCGDIGG